MKTDYASSNQKLFCLGCIYSGTEGTLKRFVTNTNFFYYRVLKRKLRIEMSHQCFSDLFSHFKIIHLCITSPRHFVCLFATM